jgi:hypothetical protein
VGTDSIIRAINKLYAKKWVEISGSTGEGRILAADDGGITHL